MKENDREKTVVKLQIHLKLRSKQRVLKIRLIINWLNMIR